MNKTEHISPEATCPPTQWSLIRLAVDGTEDQRKTALEMLCRIYWLPLYAFLRSAGRSHEVAEDIVQEFFLRLLDGRLLASATPERGRFRSLILTALKNLDHDLRRMEQTQKRGGGCEVLSLDMTGAQDFSQNQQASEATPDQAFDRAWAMTLIDRAAHRLKQHFTLEGKEALFAELYPRILGEETEDGLAAVASRLGMSAAAVKVAAFRIRRHYAEILQEEVRRTVITAEEARQELLHLRTAFC